MNARPTASSGRMINVGNVEMDLSFSHFHISIFFHIKLNRFYEVQWLIIFNG